MCPVSWYQSNQGNILWASCPEFISCQGFHEWTIALASQVIFCPEALFFWNVQRLVLLVLSSSSWTWNTSSRLKNNSWVRSHSVHGSTISQSSNRTAASFKFKVNHLVHCQPAAKCHLAMGIIQGLKEVNPVLNYYHGTRGGALQGT